MRGTIKSETTLENLWCGSNRDCWIQPMPHVSWYNWSSWMYTWRLCFCVFIYFTFKTHTHHRPAILSTRPITVTFYYRMQHRNRREGLKSYWMWPDYQFVLGSDSQTGTLELRAAPGLVGEAPNWFYVLQIHIRQERRSKAGTRVNIVRWHVF